MVVEVYAGWGGVVGVLVVVGLEVFPDVDEDGVGVGGDQFWLVVGVGGSVRSVQGAGY